MKRDERRRSATRWGNEWRQAGKRRRSRVHRPGLECVESRQLLSTAAVVNEYALPTTSAYITNMVSGPDGQVWFVESGGGKLGSIDPTTHAVAEYPLPDQIAANYVAAGPDGNLWFTTWHDEIGEFSPTSKTFTFTPTPTNGTGLAGITAGPDGNLWFVEQYSGRIGSIDPSTREITEYQIPQSGAQPHSITVGADGKLWFTEYDSGEIGSFDPATQQFQAFSTPTFDYNLDSITTGPDGNLWFTEIISEKIDSYNPTTNTFHEYTPPIISPLNVITPGPGGSLWFEEWGVGAIGSIDPSTGTVREYPLSASGTPLTGGLAVGLDGNLWFAGIGQGQIGQLSPASDASTTFLTAPTSPAIAGQSVSFTAIVATADGAAPGGTVTFTVDGQAQTPETLSYSNGRWQAMFTISGLTAGLHTVAASYGGDAQHTASASSVAAVQARAAQPPATTTDLFSSKDPVIAGQPIVFTATVSVAGQDAPTGQVTFTIDGQPFPPVSVQSISGRFEATLTDSSLAAGVHIVTASYGGDPNSAPSTSNTIGVHVDPAVDGLVTIEPITVPAVVGDQSGIVFGPDSNLWFAEGTTGKIGSINPVTRTVAEYPLAQGVDAYELTVGPDGNLWFTTFGGFIGSFNIQTHVSKIFAVPTAAANTAGITSGPDGEIWFTEVTASRIAAIDPKTDAITEFPLPTGSSISIGITAADGKLWFAEDDGKVGEFDPQSHAISEYSLSSHSASVRSITLGPDGNLWFTEDQGEIGFIDPFNHAIGEFTIPTHVSDPLSIVSGPDGDLWFTEGAARKVGKIDPQTHAITEFDIAGQLFAGTMVAGTGGTFWFTTDNDQIGRVSLGAFLPAAQVQLVASPNPALLGQPVSFTAIVSGTPGAPPTGFVTFAVDGRPFATLPLSPSGGSSRVSLSLAPLTLGNHTITVSYGGDTNYSGGSAAPLAESIVLQPTATALVVAPNPTVAGQPVLLDAVVVSPSGGIPVGSVSFIIDGQLQPPVPLTVVNGLDEAMLVTTSLSPGLHAIAAVYTGGIPFVPSVSNVAVATVQAPSMPEPDGPVVLSVSPLPAGRSSGLVLSFSAPLDPTSAQDAANYQVVSGSGHSIAVRRAIYNPTTRSVELRLAGRLNPHLTYRLTVVGTGPSGVRGANGLLLDGARSGQAGSDATMTFT